MKNNEEKTIDQLRADAAAGDTRAAELEWSDGLRELIGLDSKEA